MYRCKVRSDGIDQRIVVEAKGDLTEGDDAKRKVFYVPINL